MSEKTALIVGATGLVGRELLNVILENDYYSKILLVGRSSPEIKDNRLVDVIVDFDDLASYRDQISADHYYCCIGTTMEQAKTKEAFYKVDFTYAHELAKMAKEDPKFDQFHLVTSYGANSDSGLYYNEVKGLIEDAIKELDLSTLHIFQPSLLLGYRKHYRLWEEMAKMASSILSFFIIGSRLRFWAIQGTDVAEAMFVVAKSGETGVHVHKPLEMKRIASKKEYKGDNSITEDV
jgi:uncharacterized protein YbjT (DUF2867 family)